MSDTPQTPINKSYPAASPEVAKLLGLASHVAVPAESGLGGNTGAGLVHADHAALGGNHAPSDLPAHGGSHVISASSGGHGEDLVLENSSASNIGKALKSVTPYIVVFSVALVVYFYFFGSASLNLNLSQMFTRQAKVQTPKETLLAQMEKQNIASYQKWISQFYYDVSDPKVIDPETDNSGNGLTNFQKYLLNLNPKAYDTLGIGLADSEALAAGVNPLTGSAMTDEQKAIINKYFDMEVISNRLALAHLQKDGQVAGARTGNFGFGVQNAQAAALPGGAVQVDTSAPGRLEIPSLKIDAPLIWSANPAKFDADLQGGVIHYPGTALPGQVGTAYISGHSSNYSWAKGSYNHIFTHLNDIADDTSFTITVKTSQGRNTVLHYVVVGRQQYDPKDQAQFKNGGKSVVALSTCWPIGSTKYRMVIFGELTQVENQ